MQNLHTMRIHLERGLPNQSIIIPGEWHILQYFLTKTSKITRMKILNVKNLLLSLILKPFYAPYQHKEIKWLTAMAMHMTRLMINETFSNSRYGDEMVIHCLIVLQVESTS